METVTIPRITAKKCLDALMNALLQDHQLGPNWNHDALMAATELNDVLGCQAHADLLVKRHVIQDDPE